MCIIIAKTKPGKSPDVTTMKRAMAANPHGFAVALQTSSEQPWEIFKTMDEQEMLAWLKAKKYDAWDSRFVFHARIATHGSHNEKNCHCWQDPTSKIIFAHNGVLSIKADKDKTDSETFFRRIFMPWYWHEGWVGARKVADLLIGSSKFAFVFPWKKKHAIRLMGKYVTDENGTFYSNESAFEPVFDFKGFSPWLDEYSYFNRRAIKTSSTNSATQLTTGIPCGTPTAEPQCVKYWEDKAKRFATKNIQTKDNK